MNEPRCCVLCCCPEGDEPMVPLFWVDDPVVCRMKIAVPADTAVNDTLVCADCVRDIKRLPFSEITRCQRLSHPQPGSAMRPVEDDDDIPF